MADKPKSPEATEAPAKSSTSNVMMVKVFAPFKIYFEGEATSVSAVNDTGPFDILSNHHNFLCMLVPCTLRLETPAGQKSIKIARALMHVKSNKVDVFVDV